jgi:hypothetical protein
MTAQTSAEQAAIAASADSAPAAASTTTISSIVASLIRPGERYAGIVLADDGSISHHLFVLPGEFKGNWNSAVAWAKEAGGELPSRAELAVLFGNAKNAFNEDWYWCGEQHAAFADCAWCQNFDYGNQGDGTKSASLRARAFRRSFIS